MNSKALIAALLVATVAHAAPALAPVPLGWGAMGNGGALALPGRCELGVDGEMAAAGQANFSILCTNEHLPSFGGLNQRIETSRFRGKRVRYSALLKGADIRDVKLPDRAPVEGSAGLFFGVGTPGGIKMDRTQGRVFKGTTQWEQFDFVVDVPDNNTYMFTGFWMQGLGQLWVKDIKVEEVPLSVPVTFHWEDPAKSPVGPDLSLQ